MIRQKLIKITVLAYVVVGLLLTFGNNKWFPDFYNPKFMGSLSFISALLILTPQWIFSSPIKEKQQSLLDLQVAAAMSLLLNGLGGLGFYQLYRFGFEYDKLMHFIVPFLFTIVAAYFGHTWYEIKIHRSLFIAGVAVILVGLSWEVFEFSMDLWFGTQTLGHYGTQISKDTIVDIIMNTLGVLAGVIFVTLQKRLRLEIPRWRKN